MAIPVVQETFVKAFRHIDELSDENIQQAWLAVTSRNAAIDVYRKRYRRLEIMGDWTELQTGTARRDIEMFAEKEYIRELLLHIKPLHRQALLLIYKNGLTYEQLACIQKSSVNTVKARTHRAKLKLRSMIQVEIVR
ncbi:RNA polymerase sigma factor [Paenibacillus sp. HWE-109]|uniref:RNA polymerase sigma factor n=1 Tax=Paenibacillus sp. HWE-109 TaxID=1306526 RepID=UPI001EDF4076|nr:RNA polymerase sigma factor [Paenibacillus sp. HWE-109]UKS24536.1 RNA polymerase sigma factor [Paenibacillus sp. HWE-109]